MSAFYADSRLTIQPHRRDDGTAVWITSRDMHFRFGGPNGPTFTVPAGFETDLGSIPRWLRWLFNPSDPECSRAYVLHDFVNTLTAGRSPGYDVWSSQAAAAILYDALRVDGTGVWKARTLCTGVVLGIAKQEW